MHTGRHLGCLLLLSALCLTPPLRAHGDHGAPKVVRPPDPGLRIVGVSTERFEAVIKYRAAPLGQPVPARLFLSDAESNGPVAGAKVTLEIPDQAIKVVATPDKTAGIYLLEMRPVKAGKFDGLIDIDPGADLDEDLIPVANLELGPLPAVPPSFPDLPPWGWFVAGALSMLAALAAVYARFLRPRNASRDPAVDPASARASERVRS